MCFQGLEIICLIKIHFSNVLKALYLHANDRHDPGLLQFEGNSCWLQWFKPSGFSGPFYLYNVNFLAHKLICRRRHSVYTYIYIYSIGQLSWNVRVFQKADELVDESLSKQAGTHMRFWQKFKNINMKWIGTDSLLVHMTVIILSPINFCAIDCNTIYLYVSVCVFTT